MTVIDALLEVKEYLGEGYKPVVDYGMWRVAILNYHPELEPDALDTMQRHDETDEVFVLLSGHCILFIGEEDGTIHAVDLQPQKAYNVKKGVWHTHTLSQDATVLIVENRDTTEDNSPKQTLTSEQCLKIMKQTKQLWKTME